MRIGIKRKQKTPPGRNDGLETRLKIFHASPPETRREIIATYEAIFRNVEEGEIRESVGRLLGIFKQREGEA